MRRVAVIADVHGNAVAMAAAARDVLASEPEVLVFGGDLTVGPMPEETWRVVTELCEQHGQAVFFVRGNAERALSELRAGVRSRPATARERWVLAQHSNATLDALETFAPSLTLDLDGLGRTRFCHGSPRSDEEFITSTTPAKRMRKLLECVDEPVLVSAHALIQFSRRVAGVRSINPGSIGTPFQGSPGAYWALLGPRVELRRTEYDVEAAVFAYRASGDPLAEVIVKTLRSPPKPSAVIAVAEALGSST